MSLIEIPARRGKAAFVQAGQVVEVINTHGEQVVDTWVFSRNDLGEFLSNEHNPRAHSAHDAQTRRHPDSSDDSCR